MGFDLSFQGRVRHNLTNDVTFSSRYSWGVFQLHYLDKERFGLWALLGTLVGYLNLIDAGMTGAAARLLIDHKDDRTAGQYGSLIKTGWLVFALQGATVLLIGVLFARTFAQLLGIPDALQSEFIQIVNWQCGVMALSFATRILSLVLGAHQRMDWVNYVGVGSLLLNFAMQWLLFHYGFGVLSLVGGGVAGLVLTVVAQAFACQKLRLWPSSQGWGRVSWLHFKELFNYGRDVFLVAVGTQLIMTSQIIVITRLLGLEAAALWSVGLRVFNLVNQVVWRIFDMSAPALAEMLTRGELIRLRDRYYNVAILSFSFSGWMAVSFCLCNSLFVTLWTHDKMNWPITNDCLLGAWMVISSVIHCHNCFVGLTKQIRAMRYIYFLEGLAFVGTSSLVARPGGLAAIIGCSIMCGTLLTCTYGIWRTSRFFTIPFGVIALDWLRPMGKMLLFYLPAAGVTWWLMSSSAFLTRLSVHALLSISLGVFCLLRFGIPPELQNELLGKVSPRLMPFAKYVLLKPKN